MEAGILSLTTVTVQKTLLATTPPCHADPQKTTERLIRHHTPHRLLLSRQEETQRRVAVVLGFPSRRTHSLSTEEVEGGEEEEEQEREQEQERWRNRRVEAQGQEVESLV